MIATPSMLGSNERQICRLQTSHVANDASLRRNVNAAGAENWHLVQIRQIPFDAVHRLHITGAALPNKAAELAHKRHAMSFFDIFEGAIR